MPRKKPSSEYKYKMGQEYFKASELHGMKSSEYQKTDKKYQTNKTLTFTMSDTPYFNYNRVFKKK